MFYFGDFLFSFQHLLNSFQSNLPILYPLKTSENLSFLDVLEVTNTEHWLKMAESSLHGTFSYSVFPLLKANTWKYGADQPIICFFYVVILDTFCTVVFDITWFKTLENLRRIFMIEIVYGSCKFSLSLCFYLTCSKNRAIFPPITFI